MMGCKENGLQRLVHHHYTDSTSVDQPTVQYICIMRGQPDNLTYVRRWYLMYSDCMTCDC